MSEIFLNHFLLASASGESGWIDDLGVVLAAAGISVLVFHYLKLPAIFGYIVAGVLIGPNFIAGSLIQDPEAIRQISELGIIFLLFFIGMEFDLKRLQSVLGPAFLGILLQTIGMLYLAQALGPLFGWSGVNALFFGSLLAMSSSMVTVKVLQAAGKAHDTPTQFAIGILILEDILAVILLVVLAGVAVTQTFNWDQAWLVTFLMGVFVVIVFLIGRTIVPRILLKFTEDSKDAEILTVMSVGLVMGISVLALKLNFSPALGAFIAGTMLSQTRVAKTVETMNRSLHDIFAAVFFVSVGLQMNPWLMFDNIGWIIALSLLVIFFKVMTCWLGLCLGGQTGKTAFLAAVPKSQIGEFSFIIAGLGSSLGVMDERSAGIAFGVAFVTILLTPYLTDKSEVIFVKIEQFVPLRISCVFDAYRNILESIFRGIGANQVLKLLRRPLIQISLYFILIAGILITGSVLSENMEGRLNALVGENYWRVVYWVAFGILMSPFLYAVIRNINAIAFILTEGLFEGMTSRPIYQKRIHQTINTTIFIILILVIGLLFTFLTSDYLPTTASAAIALFMVVLIVIFLQRKLIRVNSRMEIMFLESFRQEVKSLADERRQLVFESIRQSSPWPFEIRDTVLPRNALYSGKRIRDIDLREQFGVNVLALGRGDNLVFDPVPNAPVFSGDRLVILGTKEGIEKAIQSLAECQGNSPKRDNPWQEQFRLEQVLIQSKSKIDGKTLAGADVRRSYGVTIVGIQRDDEKIYNLLPDTILRGGDILVVAGQPAKISAFQSGCERERDLGD